MRSRSATTDANGLAKTRWTLPSPVGTYGVSAVFSGLSAVAFTGMGRAAMPLRCHPPAIRAGWTNYPPIVSSAMRARWAPESPHWPANRLAHL